LRIENNNDKRENINNNNNSHLINDDITIEKVQDSINKQDQNHDNIGKNAK